MKITGVEGRKSIVFFQFLFMKHEFVMSRYRSVKSMGEKMPRPKESCWYVNTLWRYINALVIGSTSFSFYWTAKTHSLQESFLFGHLIETGNSIMTERRKHIIAKGLHLGIDEHIDKGELFITILKPFFFLCQKASSFSVNSS